MIPFETGIIYEYLCDIVLYHYLKKLKAIFSKKLTIKYIQKKEKKTGDLFIKKQLPDGSCLNANIKRLFDNLLLEIVKSLN